MILPITIYGNPVLRRKSQPIDKNYPGLKELIANMFDTLKVSEGVGLAAPQVGVNIRLVLIDATPFAEDDANCKDFKLAIINPEIIDFPTDEEESFEEGCLSLPGLSEEVWRPDKVELTYYDENFVQHHETWDGMRARIFQHEYDHLEGKMFIDHISAIKRRLLGGKLNAMAKGKVSARYRIVPNK
ncbi:MAG: peptide deformylase [Salinivirgaceae bacterium]|nr:peptide deformylase [Salinivirgaceae bacterium]